MRFFRRKSKLGFIINALLAGYLMTAFKAQAREASSLGDSEGSLKACGAEKVDLFSCVLESQNSFYLCLNPHSLEAEFVRLDKDGSRAVLVASELKQATIHMTAHGGDVVVEGDTSVGQVYIFVDSDYYDQSPPVISTYGKNTPNFTSGLVWTEYCASPDYLSDGGSVLINGRITYFDLFNLKNLFGFNALRKIVPLEIVPDWPVKGRPDWPTSEN